VVGPEDHARPPDNVQIVPELTVAHRTSPTNIGMALLATLAAHDFGFIDTEDLASRIDATLTTVESLERFEGHLLNWYDTRTLAPLSPAYISTVDSGNLGGALLTHSVPVAHLHLDQLASRAVALFDGMRSYPDTLRDESGRMVLSRQIEYATVRGVPGGISESAYNVVDRHDTFQYKAFGVPGLGLKRGLGDELVVAPYATALAAMIN